MKFRSFARAFAPVAAIAVAAALSGCDGSKVSINGEEGKPLSELDLQGQAPAELVLLGPDTVRIRTGDALAITVDGNPEAAGKLRFTLKDGSLGILRTGGTWSGGETVTVNVTMPAPRELVAAGSGTIHAEALAPEAKIVIAGSGKVETPGVAGDSLEVDVAGSGSYRAAGNTRSLKVMIAGSGDAAMDALRVETASVTIAGSGNVAFTSDGDVTAQIMGSGEVRVRGRARCKVTSMGSGRLVCETAPETTAASVPAAAPPPPPPPAPASGE